jgi:histidinol-phosphate aminotransferase
VERKSKQYSPERLANSLILPLAQYKSGKSLAAIKRELGMDSLQLDKIIKLGSNENPAGPSPLALKILKLALQDIHFYPDDDGTDLKEALADRYGLNTDSILLGHGATDILEIIVRAFVCPGDQVISAHPSFPWFQILGQLSGAENIIVPLRDYIHDLGAMRDQITAKTKLIFIANPNNPTGTVVRQRVLASFLKRVPNHVIVVLDEAYIEYVTGEPIDSFQFLVERPVIIVRTFSKICGLAGLRIGYAIADPALTRLLEKVRQPFNTTTLAHKAALASLQDRGHIEKSRQMMIKGRAFLYREFERLNIDHVQTEANFVFVDFHSDSQSIFNQLLRLGVIIRPMLGTCARITIGSYEQNVALVRTLKRVLVDTEPGTRALVVGGR